MQELFSGMCGKVAPGQARLAINGAIAIKTKDGAYKTYNLKKGTLTKVTNFVLPVGDDFFFIMPTCKVQPGDIIIANGAPKCVISSSANELKCVNYNTAVVETVLPERHIFMGKTYFYGKIVSLFGGVMKKGGGIGKMMKLMMLSSMMKGNTNPVAGMFGGTSSEGGSNGGLGQMLPLMMMMGGGKDMFDGMLDFGMDDSDGEDFTIVDEDDEDDDEDERPVVVSPKKTSKKKAK